MKKFFLLAAGAFLLACSDGDEHVVNFTPDMEILLNAKKDFNKDTVIYLADSLKFVEKINQFSDFGDEDNTLLIYKANATSTAINMNLFVLPGPGGGSIEINCFSNEKNRIVFEEPVLPARSEEGYTLKFLDSLKAGESTYYDVLEFDASKAQINQCYYSTIYYGVHDGLIKVVSKSRTELNRVPAKVYEDALERRAKERAYADSVAQAVADSIAQAVADSIAQAVADSIIKANTPADDSSVIEIEIPQEVIDLADSVANCIKKAYSSGSLSALKKCSI